VRRFWLPVGGTFAATVGCIAGVALVSAGATESARHAAVPTATATAVPSDASVLSSTSLLPLFRPADGQAIEEVAQLAYIAALPTATAVPPTPTAAPPAPAPAAPKQAPPRQAPPPAAPPATSSGLDTSPMNPLERALFDDTNRRRASAGLPPLRANQSLVGIARIRSHDMADHDYFSHTSPVTGDTAFSLMDKYGIAYGWAGENLAENNYPTDQCEGVADDALWNSPPHRENILGAHYTDVGVGYAVDASGMSYFTIVFTGPA
jgi:uncharacterized protein YkwD